MVAGKDVWTKLRHPGINLNSCWVYQLCYLRVYIYLYLSIYIYIQDCCIFLFIFFISHERRIQVMNQPGFHGSCHGWFVAVASD